ncbi:hypothetical protein G8D19_21565 [Xanthomonas vesicatoria]|uniref:hypothetical protein n=1 Tax=Xanthomonas vesicatoria TaxID=56460 RepID=UPI000AA5F019|nr:hypothetical protein [Xanthomonas vesicatoria]MDG4491605.1 hypothetical protein [Xanthomonas vesicatoria]
MSKNAIKVFLMIGHLSCLNSLALGTPHTFPCLLSDPSKVFIGVKHQMEDCEKPRFLRGFFFSLLPS